MRIMVYPQGLLAAALLMLSPLGVDAQDMPGFECDNRFGECGTPEMSGGGGGGGGGKSTVACGEPLDTIGAS